MVSLRSTTATRGDVPISFISSGTSLSNASSGTAGFDLTTDDHAGVIHITGTAVPEPSSLVLVASAIGMMLLSRGYQQARKRSTR